MSVPDLLVCSVFAGTEYDRFWLELQRTQLYRNTGEFHHAVYLGHGADRTLFRDCTIVGQSLCGQFSRPGHEHLGGLKALAEYCRSQRYGSYLILDSDAFPIAPNWKSAVSGLLARFTKSYAAVVRTENLDTFPHPCVVYTQDPGTLVFDYQESRAISGLTTLDISCLADEYLPLIRTNRISPHPLLASIYLDMFYHHGCGSRQLRMRSITSGYYDNLLPSSSSSERLLEQLMKDPTAFIAWLRHGKLAPITHSQYEEPPSETVAAQME